MDKFKAALDSLKKIASAKDEQEMFRLFSENKENFDTVQQRWFGHSRDTETVQVQNEDYLQNIVRYVDITLLRLVPGRMPSEAWLLDFLFMFSQLTV